VQSAQDLMSIAAAIEPMAGSVDESIRKVAVSASERAPMTNTVKRDLAYAASRINDAIRLINSIVALLDLRALKATIEAGKAEPSNVHAPGFATNQTVQPMTEVVKAADEAGTVRTGAAAIGPEATARQTEIDRFLIAVRRGATDRRRHERVLGHGTILTVRISGKPPATAELRDLSHSGAALASDWDLPAGQEIELDLPNGGGVASGRVLRCKDGFLILVFRQDRTTKDRVSRAMDLLASKGMAA
jgi:hypothetical protein